VFSTKLINFKFCSDIIPCWPRYDCQLSLQNTTSNFTVNAVQHLKLQIIYTKYRKTLTFIKSDVQICSPTSPHFTVLSVPDTRTAFIFCCSINWKRKTDGNFVLSNITWALDTDELIGSRPDRFIRRKKNSTH